MYGAVLGDMIGAPYEFDRGNKTKDFPLFSRESQFTDDSVMSIAIADALLSIDNDADDETVHHAVMKAMKEWGRKYPHAGYGGRFRDWLFSYGQPKPYHSWGNGSAMRVSSVGWLYGSMEETRRAARLTAEVTHNHPEGIKGAEATASAIFLARNSASKNEIREYIIREFGYDLSKTCDEIRPTYHHVESCQETVPEAITAFLEGKDFENVIRTAVSLGGDCDTLTCIAGSIAEAFYGVPEEMLEECRKRLPEDMLEVLDRFEETVNNRQEACRDHFLDGNEMIEAAISDYYADSSKDHLIAVLDAIRTRMHADGDVEYTIPEDPITPELLSDGSYLKRAVGIFNRNRTQLNMFKLFRILRDSLVWVPCNAILGNADQKAFEEFVKNAEINGGVESLAGKQITSQDIIRMEPDILKNGEEFFFPVFTAAEEMGEYGDHFSKVQRHFLETIRLARNNEKNISGIVINAFSQPLVVPAEFFEMISSMESSLQTEDADRDSN